MANQKYIGGDFDDYLAGEGIKDEVEASARARVAAMTTQPTPPTADELAAMRARVDAATAGPWVMIHDDDEYSMNLYAVAPESTAHKVETDECGVLNGFICGTLVQVPKTIGHSWSNELNDIVGPKYEENAVFIAHARRDMQTLLDEVERLRKENTSLRESLDLSDLIINSETLK